MAKTQSLDVPDELRTLHARSIEMRDRYVLGVVQSHKHLPSRNQKSLLKRTAQISSPQQGRGSIFKFLSPYWRALNTTQKNIWKDSAVFSGMSGWQLFVSDNSARIQNNFTFPVLPANTWQVRAGRIEISAPSNSAVFMQAHPQEYLVAEKVPGKSWKKQLQVVKEQFSFPLTIKISYKSDLFAYGTGQVARFRASILTSYQGEDIYTDLVIDFDTDSDWQEASATITSLRGIFISYNLYIEIFGYRGIILFDNVRAIHTGTNWARDFRCDEVDKVFTKAFALVPPFWVPVDFGTGVVFSSTLPF